MQKQRPGETKKSSATAQGVESGEASPVFETNFRRKLFNSNRPTDTTHITVTAIIKLITSENAAIVIYVRASTFLSIINKSTEMWAHLIFYCPPEP